MQQHLKLSVVITTRRLFCLEHQLGAITIDKKIIEKKSLTFLVNPIMNLWMAERTPDYSNKTLTPSCLVRSEIMFASATDNQKPTSIIPRCIVHTRIYLSGM